MERKPPLTLGQIEDLCTAGKDRCDQILTHLEAVRRLMGEPLVPAEIAAVKTVTPALPAPRRGRRIKKRGGVSDLAPTAPPVPPPTGMITVKEATAKAGCTDVTIYKALKDGDLKGQKMGPRRTMVWVASLDAWIAARKSPAAPSADPPPAPPKRRGRPPKVAARIPLSSILHSPASPPLPYESRPRHNGEASPINPTRFQPHD